MATIFSSVSDAPFSLVFLSKEENGFRSTHFVALRSSQIMDSYPSLIPIKIVLKVSEEELKTKLKSPQGISGEAKAIKEIFGLECRIDLHGEVRRNEVGEKKGMIVSYLTLFNIDEYVEIYSNFVICIKPAGFLEYRGSYHRRYFESFRVKICTFTDLFDPEKKFIVDGEFVIEMKGIIFLKEREMKTINYGINFAERLWEDEEERDFTIIVKEDDGNENEIKVHKLVLALRSPVFQRMFKTDMKEKQEGKVEIIDFDLDTVKLAVAFCYDQDILDEYPNWQQLVALHRFADKYDIEDLKEKTELCLVEKIFFENICEISNAAINLNAPQLQDFCFRFLLMAVKEGIPFKDIDKLNNEIAADLLKKSMADKYC